jgi:hypothetical protein
MYWLRVYLMQRSAVHATVRGGDVNNVVLLGNYNQRAVVLGELQIRLASHRSAAIISCE